MRVVVSCFSQTGNTALVSKAIAKQLSSKGIEPELREIAELNSDMLSDVDLLFLGSACHSATLAGPVLGLLASIPEDTHLKVAGFATHSCRLPGVSPRDTELYNRWAGRCQPAYESAAEKGRIELLGYFGCVGAPSEPIQGFIHSQILPDEEEWKDYIQDVMKHPDVHDLERAAQFASDMLEKAMSDQGGVR